MSWSGFKKNVNRATTQVMMKTGHVEKTSDREYEVEERRYRTLESASLRLQKEAKGYLDSLRAMTASQMRIAETIDAFYGDSGATDGVSRSYKQAVEDLDSETVKALDGPYRCVTQDPATRKIASSCVEDVLERDRVLAEVEAELNWRAGNRRTFTAGQNGKDIERASQLIEFVYRTTVLEPINRFCAYFPDINECIKKRNHKMLDYDAMRSKVKKLVEKPDKDPAKLPRTEKETEMVNATNPLRSDPVLGDATPSTSVDRFIGDGDTTPRAKALEGYQDKDKYFARVQADEDAVLEGIGLQRSTSLTSRVTNIGRRMAASLGTGSPISRNIGSRHARMLPSMLPDSSTEALPGSSSLAAPGSRRRSASRNLSSAFARIRQLSWDGVDSPLLSRGNSLSELTRDITRSHTPFYCVQTPFFSPCELEDVMAPLKTDFIERYADLTTQAKAAYDQLNEQLTNELPQLIDLRVPYLDPTFEALVKIQLRFCAEAYSRMAQVQQYLDASTRDQYASGDLDARVEDVLGQIRELSIAGTV